MRLIGAVTRLVAAIAIAGAAAVVPAASASAAPDYFEFSTDGVHWTSTQPAFLFDPDYRVSPGDTESASIFIRSTRAAPTEMSAAITDLTASDAGFGRAITIDATGGPGPGVHDAAADLPACAAIFRGFTVRQNQSVHVTIGVTMSPALTAQEQQRARLGFNLIVGLADAGVPTAPGSCLAAGDGGGGGTTIPGFPGGSSGSMALTGTGTLYPGLIIGGAILVAGSGLIIVGLRRRRRADDRS